MSSYLHIAEKILEAALQPLNAKEILRRAYLENLVPPDLYGRTQHKTLHARICEDIRRNGLKSAFYRTERGVFFPVRLRNLPHLTEKQKQGIIARPRYRELQRKPVLTLNGSTLKNFSNGKMFIPASDWHRILSFDENSYQNFKSLQGTENYSVWAFVVVQRGNDILTYRQGRYRENRDGFVNLRTIGFKTLLTSDDQTFLDREDHGVLVAGLSSAFADLGIPLRSVNFDAEKQQARIEFIALLEDITDHNEAVCVVTYSCPDWLEPLKRRLAINDLGWMKSTHLPNNMDDFDEWSKKIIPQLFSMYQQRMAAHDNVR